MSKVGRPEGWRKAPEKAKTARIVFCCTPAQAEALKRKAKDSGKTVSAYILNRIFL